MRPANYQLPITNYRRAPHSTFTTHHSPFPRRRRAFTLVELILVLVIIAVLAAAAVTNFAKRTDQARTTTAASDISTIDSAIDAFKIDTAQYPADQDGLNALMVQPSGLDDWKGPYLKKLPQDPWHHAYNYKYPGTHNNDYDLWSSGPDGRDGTDDDITNWQTSK